MRPNSGNIRRFPLAGFCSAISFDSGVTLETDKKLTKIRCQMEDGGELSVPRTHKQYCQARDRRPAHSTGIRPRITSWRLVS